VSSLKNRFYIFLTVFVCIMLALFGCTAAKVSGQATDLMTDIPATEQRAGSSLPDEAARQVINHFSAALFQASADNKGNVMISPASVYLALAMTLNGADGETKAAFLQVLAEQELTVELINEACRDWLSTLNKTGGKTKLAIANSIWYDQNFMPYKPFLQTNANYYAAGVRKLDFKDKGAPEIINNWVKEATEGTIDEIVEFINPDVVMYLINAIYFKSDWQTPFDRNETRNQTFTTPEGVTETPFLHQTARMDYFTGPEASGVVLPYDDGQFAYFALLPDGQMTPREWLARQDSSSLLDNLAGMMAQKADFTIELSMPKFESRYEDSLLNELTRLGLGIAFDPNRADFSQMNEEHTRDLFISEVKHKTFVRVDEKGTEAAAVTSVEVAMTAVPLPDKQLTFDRPFIYGIMDLNTGTSLFLGIMENPTIN
jgi:serpin B